MKKWVKAQAVCLVVVMLMFGLVGCGGDSGNKDTSVIPDENKDTRQPILIQGQFDGETEVLFAAIENSEKVTVGTATYYVGTIDNYPVIAVDSMVGMINAAANTAAAILTFNPYCVINQGTAGGHSDDLYVGDIVLGETTVNINAMISEPRAEGEGMDPENWVFDHTDIWVNGEKQEIYELHADPELLAIAESIADTYDHGKVVKGVIGSGDFWNKEVDRILWIRDHYNTSVEEMESFSTANTCRMWGVPWLGIRVLSNSEITNGEYTLETGEWCQEYTLAVVREIIKNI